MENKTKEFIQKLKDKGVYNENYDYSEVEFVNYKTKVKITFNGHQHLILPNSVLNGSSLSIKNVTNKNDFLISQFKDVHGDKYDYSKVEYKNDSTYVGIICPKHGEFKQSSNEHKRGGGCGKCRGRGLTN